MKEYSVKIFILFSAFILFLTSGCSVQKHDGKIFATSYEVTTEVSKLVRLPLELEVMPQSPNVDSVLRNYYGVDEPSVFSDFSVIMCGAEDYTEIAVFKFDSSEGRIAAEKAVKTRKNKMVECYDAEKRFLKNPEKYGYIKESKILRYDNAIVLIVADDNNFIENIIDKFSDGMV